MDNRRGTRATIVPAVTASRRWCCHRRQNRHAPTRAASASGFPARSVVWRRRRCSRDGGIANVYIHSAVSAGGDVAASRSIGFRNRTVNLTANLDAKLDARVDVGLLSPSYVFATPVLGGQLAINVLAVYGRQQASIDANLNRLRCGPDRLCGTAERRPIPDCLR